MFSFKKVDLSSVDSILADFHDKLVDLENLIKDRAVKVEQATVAEAKAIEQRLMHNAEIDKAKAVYTKIKDFIS